MKTNITLSFLLFLFGNAYSQELGFEKHAVIDFSYSANDAYFAHSADLDGDGDLDILYASRIDHKIAWYENVDGQGTYGPRQLITTNAKGILAVVSADIDKDGDLDVLSASTIDDKIAWYENVDGKGRFSNQQIISTNADGAWAVHAADMDGDGDLDVLSASKYDRKLAWYENVNGEGLFGDQQLITREMPGANSVIASDLDQDGDMDVLATSDVDDHVVWYENLDGFGNFGASQLIDDTADGALSVLAEDLDGDGDMDVVAASKSNDRVAWYENTNGQGAFSAPIIISSIADNVRSIYVEDLDGDGDLDVLSGSVSDYKVAWYENTNGLGLFSSERIIAINESAVTTVSASDLDNDGDMDVISTSLLDSEIAWFENTDGQGAFGTEKPVSFNTPTANAIITVDLDGDNDLDVVTTSFVATDHNGLAWHENIDGEGTFENIHLINTNGNKVFDVYAADLDGDGDMDLVTGYSHFNLDRLIWYENTDGKGTFVERENIVTISTAGVTVVSAADMDGDGDLDILQGTVSFENVAWYENMDGLGHFGELHRINYASAKGVKSISPVDLDGDGDLDIIYASSYLGEDKIIWQENLDGKGNFGAFNVLVTNLAGVRAIHVEDLDGDGDLDVLSASRDDDKIAWYENLDGRGGFGEERLLTTDAQNALSVSAGDLDNDGDIDVLSGSFSDQHLAWYENLDGKGTFGEKNFIDYANGNPIALGDLDNDGDLDVLSTRIISSGSSTIGNDINWYENLSIIGNEIQGNIRLDLEGDGCDGTDRPISDLMVIADNGSNRFGTFTQEDGTYSIFTNEGDFHTFVTSMLPFYYDVNPDSVASDFTTDWMIDTVNFCVSPNQEINDLSVNLVPLSEARPGFDLSYQLIYTNTGTTTLSGNVVLEFDEDMLTFLTATEVVDEQTSQSLTFDFDALAPFETRTITLVFKVFPPPIVNLDDFLLFKAEVRPILGDFTSTNNTAIRDQLVIGSFDPNDIRVMEGEELLLDEVSNYLHYIIRFQNTGTASAINVKVENTLDIHLDWNTLQLESTSHAGKVEIENDREITFRFDNINLPDSSSNEAASNGYIIYKIKPKADIGIGDVILNEAAIFFDFNEAIETNTVKTKIVAPPAMGVDVQSACESFTWIDGINYTESNDSATYTIVKGAANGADSIVTLQLSIYQTVFTTDSQVACDSFIWIDGLTYTENNNSAMVVFENASSNNCDSTVTLDLVIETVDASVSRVVDTLTANEVGAAYQWIDCATGLPIVGANSMRFVAVENGRYAVEVRKNNCVKTSDCVDVITSSLEDVRWEEVRVYPNPGRGMFRIEFGDLQPIRLVLRDVTSRKLLAYKDLAGQAIFNLEIKESGVYFIEVVTKGGSKNFKVQNLVR